jgi:hypothetical protein
MSGKVHYFEQRVLQRYLIGGNATRARELVGRQVLACTDPVLEV